jgi:hypothetical protein
MTASTTLLSQRLAARIRLLAAIGVLIALGLAAGDAIPHGTTAPGIYLGRRWPADKLVSLGEIDHSGWDALLKRHVDETGRVDYAAWQASAGDVAALDDYLSLLSRADPDGGASRSARLTFWINAYNAVTVRAILQTYPRSINPPRAGSPRSFDIWRDCRLRVGGASYSLGQIEHRLLRPLNEPRVHFAIVCGSRGCPRLLNRAYGAADLDEQLSRNARDFFANPDKLDFDEAVGKVRLSPILDWYAEDFGSTPRARLEAIIPYLPQEIAKKLRDERGVRVEYLEYDWGLNDKRPPADFPPFPPEPLPGEN